MKKFSVKDILIPVISLFLICAIATALLALTNRVTASLIAENDKKTEMLARQAVLPEAADFEERTVEDQEKNVYEYVVGLGENGKVVGYVFTTSANGYGGEVQVMTGRDVGGTITAVEILSCSDETPGLGQNSKKDEWNSQYDGKSGELEVVKSSPSDSQIQAITSATITSKAVTSAVNETLDIYDLVTSSAAESETTGGETNG